MKCFDFDLAYVFKLIYAWCEQKSADSIAHKLGMSPQTVMKFYRLLRRIVCMALRDEKLVLGGRGKVVEIDESQISRAKHNRGKALKIPPVWVFGLKDRHTGKCIMKIVERRNADTLLPILIDSVAEHTVVYSDRWAANDKISEQDKPLYHQAVNHSITFVEAFNRDIHTNGIESLWRCCKHHLKAMYGVWIE